MKFDKKFNGLILPILIFLIVFFVSWWSNPPLIPKTSPDSGTYIGLAERFIVGSAEIRPFLFPLLIKLCMYFPGIYWQQIFSSLQISLHALICIMLFYLYIKCGLKKNISFILTLIIGFNPSLIYYTTYVLADHLHAVLTTLAWLSTIIFIQRYNKKSKNNIYLILIGIFSGLAIVTKPISILGIFPLLFTYIIVAKRSYKMLIALAVILCINYSFHIIWENYKQIKSVKLQHETIENIKSNNLYEGVLLIDPWWFNNHLIWTINMAAIRGGLVNYGEGTPLYNDIKSKNLLQSASLLDIDISYTSDDDPTYWEIRKSISRNVSNDKEFAKKILYQVPHKLFFIQISKWHSFFTKRCFGPGDSSFPHMPALIRYIYVVGYSLIYRPLLVMLLLSSFIILWRKRLLTLLISSYGILFYASFSIALLTPHSGEFPRYRVWIEYIMLFCALFPIGIIMEFCYSKLYLIIRQITTKPINN